MAYGPAVPPTLPDNAEQQRRQISDYQVQTPKSAASGQGYVNDTNTSILNAIAPNRANDDNPQIQNFGTNAPGNQGPSNTSPGTKVSGALNTNTDIIPQPNVLDLPAILGKPVCT